MAVSIIQEPSTRFLQTTRIPIILQAYEDANAAEPKYRFILEIKDSAGASIATLKTFPSGPNSNSTAFDVSNIVNDYLSNTVINSNQTANFIATLGTTGYVPSKTYSSSGDGTYGQSAQFELELGYEYAPSLTEAPVEYRNQQSTTFFAFRNAPDSYVTTWAASRGDGRYQADVGNTGSLTDAANQNNRFMSGAPLLGENPSGLDALEMIGTNIQSSESYTLAFSPVEKVATQITRLIDRVFVRCYDASGTIIGFSQNISFDISNGGPPSFPVSNQEDFVYYFGAGPKNLEEQTDNSTLAGYFSGGTVAYYYVWGAYSVAGGDQVTGVFKFTIEDNCSKYPSRRIAYLNRLGTYDYFTFNQRSVKSLSKINRSTFRKGRGNWDQITNTTQFGYGVVDRGETVTNVEADQIETLSTDWMNARYVTMIEDLVTSPSVFIYDSGNPSGAVPVLVTDTAFITKTNANDKLFNYTIKVKYANRPYLQ